MSSSSARRREASIAGLDKLLGHRSRLAVLVLLADGTRLTFKRLAELLDETDGNMGAHLRKLVAAEYISVASDRPGGRQPRWYSITGEGRAALRSHLDALQSFVDQLDGVTGDE
ncbi:MAG: transcriptional regulator [Gemmatimonadota bacterium]